jgi:hypothetical protein
MILYLYLPELLLLDPLSLHIAQYADVFPAEEWLSIENNWDQADLSNPMKGGQRSGRATGEEYRNFDDSAVITLM